MNVKLRKGGRTAVKMSIDDFKKILNDTYKRYAMDKDLDVTKSYNKHPSILALGAPNKNNDKLPYLKTLHKEIWEDEYKFDCENYDTCGDIKILNKGVPYVECYAGGDWESPVCIFIYFDGDKFRAYIPLKGNALCPATHEAYGNDCDNEESKEIKQLMKEFNVKNKEELPIDPRSIVYNKDACLEDFTERLTVKGSYKYKENPQLEKKYKDFSERKQKEKERREYSINESCKKIVRNENGDVVPEACPVCGSKVGLYLKGEPVYLCSNEKCGKYFGTMPFHNHNKKKKKKKKDNEDKKK